MNKLRLLTDEYNVQVLHWQRPRLLLSALFFLTAASVEAILALVLSSTVLWLFAAAIATAGLVQSLRLRRLLRRLKEVSR